jgi:hypothetical protein
MKYAILAVVVAWFTFAYHDEIKGVAKKVPQEVRQPICNCCEKLLALLRQ